MNNKDSHVRRVGSAVYNERAGDQETPRPALKLPEGAVDVTKQNRGKIYGLFIDSSECSGR